MLPKYLMFENVKNLVSKKFIDDFNNLLEVLDELGFNSYWKVLNAKDCGIPQNRERVFVISIRKDIDNGAYDFPKPFDTGIRLKDVLDKKVDEKYYLSEKALNYITAPKRENKWTQILSKDSPIAKSALTAKGNMNWTGNFIKENTNIIKQIGNYRSDSKNFSNPQTGRVYSSDYISPILNTMQGGDRQPKIIEPVNTMPDGTARTIEAQYAKTSKANFEYSGTYGATGVKSDNRVRKLTPTECWKLMGLTEEDCINAKNIGVADSQLYKQAGNGIVTNCVELLAEHLYKAQYDNAHICTDERLSDIKGGVI